MSLVYKNDTYNYNGEYEMSSLNKFARAEKIVCKEASIG